MFNTMINGEGSFAEKTDKKVSVPFSSRAVEMMVKFIYGIELEDWEDIDVYLELIEIGGVYGIENLDKAAAEKIKQKLTKENVFNILSFSHLHKADDLKKICMEMIISKFCEKAVLEQKAIIDCPELAVELWKLFKDKKKDRHKTTRASSEDTMVSSDKLFFTLYISYLHNMITDFVNRFSCLINRNPCSHPPLKD